ncbi:protein ILRUN-like [Mercenaria mercenaria]|uniref:protein ILRUN-like n=1 Tax=Mercenaria mercenaria TaxID=6596 RepID=UPI001E1DF838|nr:protein ILRUN-like [Mercenaria mercenaria]
MDVDNDLDGQLLQQFSSLGTTDKEVLIAEFQKLLGNQLNPAGCAFFLDMNNWNLQAAICSYYDFDQPSVKLPELAFISDVTIGDGEAVPPNTTFTKTWRVANSGDEPWPAGCQLKFCSGENLANTDRAVLGTLNPKETADISVQMHSPAAPAVYQSQWRMCTSTGMYFGEPIWVIITVAEGGVLAVTQQLSRFGNDFVQNPAPQNIPNPFASPTKSTLNNECSGNNAAFMSPNNSMVAQQGSPYTNQLSPSPVRTPHPVGPGDPARSLFQASGGMEDNTNCDTSHSQEEMS